jgi:multidrug transporter EmrE-like cation transporter
MNDKLIGWLLILLAAVLNGAGSLLHKQSRLRAADPGLLAQLLSPWFLAGLVCYGVNVILFARALDQLRVSLAYPVLAGASFVIISARAAWVFHERLGPAQWAGAVLILVGIFLVACT